MLKRPRVSERYQAVLGDDGIYRHTDGKVMTIKDSNNFDCPVSNIEELKEYLISMKPK
jgi:hypothetical protein